MTRTLLLILRWLALLLVPSLIMFQPALAAPVATPSSLILKTGEVGTVIVTNNTGTTSISGFSTSIVTATYANGVITITPKAAGTTTVRVTDGTGSGNRAYIGVTVVNANTVGTSFALTAWNDLGMHCMDSDYSVFSILPPYNNLHAQLVDRSGTGIATQNVSVSFEAMADLDGSINSISSTKTNFWQNAKNLFGADLLDGVGLTGYGTASYTPQALRLDGASGQFVAEGIPITPYDDAGNKNPYPMVKVVARDANGNELAQAHVVLPVSDEMTCVACHASGSVAAAKPAAGWVNDANPERDFRRNILRLHDQKQLPVWKFKLALKQKGYELTGLLATADKGKAILCSNCHASNALPGTGVSGIKPLTEAIHSHHAMVTDPTTGQPLDSLTNRDACYQCHPGSNTKCLRGAMGKATLADGSQSMQCQSCHGTMSNVGRKGRVGWLEQPNCQACHHDGKRELNAVSNTGILKTWLDTRFATNPDTPGTGFSLYRFSKGHGNLQCEACHGSTHAVFPSAHANDNVLAKDLQGHEGTVAECTACHATVPLTYTDGPHGLHTVGSAWVTSHRNYANNSAKRATCTACHGADYRGSVLSKTSAARNFGNNRVYTAGQPVTCYDCHNGPNGGG